jgi:hypothetical protein
MKIRILALLITLTGAGVIIIKHFSYREGHSREPIIITGYASYEEVSLDGLILESDAIVIGELDSTAPSRWNTVDGKLPVVIDSKNINSKYTIFTDQMFVSRVFIKGRDDNLIRIRYFGGQVDQDVLTISGEVVLETAQSYLLFLVEDTLGTTAEIDQGHYIVLGSIQGVYKISEDKAISFRDEWLLADLITYIENALTSKTIPSTETPLPTPTP